MAKIFLTKRCTVKFTNFGLIHSLGKLVFSSNLVHFNFKKKLRADKSDFWHRSCINMSQFNAVLRLKIGSSPAQEKVGEIIQWEMT